MAVFERLQVDDPNFCSRILKLETETDVEALVLNTRTETAGGASKVLERKLNYENCIQADSLYQIKDRFYSEIEI